MSRFSVEDYNNLPGINEAHALLQKQLGGVALQRLIGHPAIRKLFLQDKYACKFGICILHRHHELKDAERMVSSAQPPAHDPKVSLPRNVFFTRPYPSDATQQPSSAICADRWMRSGDEFEHTVIPIDGQPISPPPSEFFTEFRRICDEFGVDTLGICAGLDYFPPPDHVFLEMPAGNPEDRTQITVLVRKDQIPDHLNSRQSAWVPVWKEVADDSAGEVTGKPLVPVQFRMMMAEFDLNTDVEKDKVIPDDDPANDARLLGKITTLSCVHNCAGHS